MNCKNVGIVVAYPVVMCLGKYTTKKTHQFSVIRAGWLIMYRIIAVCYENQTQNTHTHTHTRIYPVLQRLTVCICNTG
jgi:hypothetical protein